VLFYLSGEHGSRADFAAGPADPTFFDNGTHHEGGADGKRAFECENEQLRHIAAREII
jgi:hypothetical protein